MASIVAYQLDAAVPPLHAHCHVVQDRAATSLLAHIQVQVLIV
jgi:hypothetical protein